MATTYPKVTGVEQAGGYVASAAYASLPAASGYPAGTKAWATDINTEMYSNGTRWLPVNGRAPLGYMPLPCIKAPTINANASGTANGSTTLATAVQAAFAKGYFYVPANSLHASAQPNAGWYYGEMSSTTAIKFYNNTYTPAAGTLPTEPTNKVEFSGAVPGGTGVATEVTALVVRIPAGLLGSFGAVHSDLMYEVNNNANVKLAKVFFGAFPACAEPLISIASTHGINVIRNVAPNRQRSAARIVPTNSANTYAAGTVDSSAAVDVSYTLGTSGSGADYAALVSAYINAEAQA